MALHVESFVLEGNSEQPLKLPTKRYTLTQAACKDDGWTVLFAHGMGLHKEQWEPVIENILRDEELHVCQAWSLDCQSHGDGGVINEEYLESRADGVSITEWAAGMANFVKFKRLNPCRTVAIGHSAGSCAMALSTKHFPVNEPPFAALILVDPVMVPKLIFEQHIKERRVALKMLMHVISSQREVWASKEDAFAWMMKRFPWKKWDPRAVRLYADHGLRDTVVDGTPSAKSKCTKKQEASPYSDWEPHFAAMERCIIMHKSMPIHFIFGEEIDLVPKYQQEAIVDPLQGGCTPASVQTVLESGHMVPQEKPDDLARAIRNVLTGLKPASVSSKL